MPYLLLVRHSLVDPSAIGPDSDWPLSSKGRALCVPLAEALRPFEPQIVYSSPMLRARETAGLAAAYLGIDVRTAAGLEEHRRPFVPGGSPAAEFEATMRHFFSTPSQRVFGDESADECRDRFADAVEGILTSEPSRNVAVVSHGTVLALYAAPFFNLSSIDLWSRIGWPSLAVIDTASRRGVQIIDSVAKEG